MSRKLKIEVKISFFSSHHCSYFPFFHLTKILIKRNPTLKLIPQHNDSSVRHQNVLFRTEQQKQSIPRHLSTILVTVILYFSLLELNWFFHILYAAEISRRPWIMYYVVVMEQWFSVCVRSCVCVRAFGRVLLCV